MHASRKRRFTDDVGEVYNPVVKQAFSSSSSFYAERNALSEAAATDPEVFTAHVSKLDAAFREMKFNASDDDWAKKLRLKTNASEEGTGKYSVWSVNGSSKAYKIVDTESGKEIPNYVHHSIRVNAAKNGGDGLIGYSGGMGPTAPVDTNDSFNYKTASISGMPAWEQQGLHLIDFFGPAFGLRDPDPLRQQHQQDFPLPQIWKDKYSYNSNIVMNEVLGTNDFLLTSILPIVYNNDFSKIAYQELTFDHGLMSPVPWESVGRMLTSTTSSKTFESKRWGLALMNEKNFYETEYGRQFHFLQLLQMKNCVVQTFRLGAITALVNTRQDYDISNRLTSNGVGVLTMSEWREQCSRTYSDWAIIQRCKDGIDSMAQGMLDRAEARRIERTGRDWALMLPSGVQMYTLRLPDKRDFINTGTPRSTFDLESQFEVRGLKNAFEVQPFPTGAGQAFVNPMYTTMEFGSHVVFPGFTDHAGDVSKGFKTEHCDMQMFNYGNDGEFQKVSYHDAVKFSFLLDDGTYDVLKKEPKNLRNEAKEVSNAAAGSAADAPAEVRALFDGSDDTNAALKQLEQVRRRAHAQAAQHNDDDSYEARNFVDWYTRELQESINARLKETRDESANPLLTQASVSVNGTCSVADFYKWTYDLFGGGSSVTFFKRISAHFTVALVSSLCAHYGVANRLTLGGQRAAIPRRAASGDIPEEKGRAAETPSEFAIRQGEAIEHILDMIPFGSRYIAFALDKNIPLFIPIMASRAHIRWYAGMAILVVAGQETGVTQVGNSACMVGDIASVQVYTMSFTTMFVNAVLREKNVIQHRAAFIRKYEGGGGLKFASLADRKSMRDGIYHKDMIARALYPGEHLASDWEATVMETVGKPNPIHCKSGKQLYSTAGFYAPFWNEFHTEVDYLREPIVANRPHDNTLIPREVSYEYNCVKGDWSKRNRGVGWTGDFLRNGMCGVFKTYGKYLDYQSSIAVTTMHESSSS